MENKSVEVQQESSVAQQESSMARRWTVLYAIAALIIGYILGSCVRRPPETIVEIRKEVFPQIERHEITRIMLPFYEADVSHCDPSDFGKGATLMDGSEQTFALVMRGLRWCGADRPVEIDVQGFSSKRPFNCGTQEASDHLNIKLAEARRDKILSMIDKTLKTPEPGLDASVVQINPAGSPRWTGSTDQQRLEDMRQQLAFQDTVDKAYGKTPETFTRRVDILIRSKGRCAQGASG
jgi:hypothetical protein